MNFPHTSHNTFGLISNVECVLEECSWLFLSIMKSKIGLNCVPLINLLVTGSLASMAEIQQSNLSLGRWNFRKGTSRWLSWSATATRTSFRIAPTLSTCTTLAVGPTLMWCLTQTWVQELFASMIPTDLFLKICLCYRAR